MGTTTAASSGSDTSGTSATSVSVNTRFSVNISVITNNYTIFSVNNSADTSNISKITMNSAITILLNHGNFLKITEISKMRLKITLFA